MTSKITKIVLLFLLAVPSFAQSSDNVLLQTLDSPKNINPTDVIVWELAGGEAYSDNKVLINLRLTTKQNFTLYTTKVKFNGAAGYTAEIITKPEIEVIKDPITSKEVEVFRAGEFQVLFTGLEPFTKESFPLSITFLGCTSKICLLPYTQNFDVKVFSFPTAFIHPNQKNNEQPDDTAETSTGAVSAENAEQASVDGGCSEEGFEEQLNCYLKEGGLPIAMILLIIFLGGLATNLTPCVYPMIPITIRVLSGQGGSPLFASSAYALGILLTYTALGMFAALTGSLFGNFMASDSFNIVFGAIMVVFGVTMLGFGNMAFLQSIGSKIGTGKASAKNAFLMGTGAGLVASPCTGPILATLLTFAAKDANIARSALYLFIYSFGFSLPYVFLGSFSAKIAKRRVSPRIQVAVKLFFAAVMFALGFYYLRIPAYGLLKALSEYWPMITSVSLGIGLVMAIGILLSQRFQMKKGLQIIPAALLGLGIFTSTQWLAQENAAKAKTSLTWYYSEAEGLAVSKANNAPILLDAWAEWCEACKKMDATTFADETVIKTLNEQGWIIIKIDVTESNDQNDAFLEKYGIQSLPTLTLLPPGGDIAGAKQILGYVSAKALLNRIAEFRSH